VDGPVTRLADHLTPGWMLDRKLTAKATAGRYEEETAGRYEE
jgi:hypothetical protein